MKNQKGFSLVELLIVVIIIAIIAAIAIPNLLASRRAGNEASAISSLRTIHSANSTYQATTGGGINYATLATLGTAGLLDGALGVAAPTKSGYDFTSSIPATAPFNVYCANAAPDIATGATRTGDRYFGVRSDGVLFQHTAALACTDGALTTTGGTQIQ